MHTYMCIYIYICIHESTRVEPWFRAARASSLDTPAFHVVCEGPSGFECQY